MNGNAVKDGENRLLKKPPLKVRDVDSNGIGEMIGICPGDQLVSINDHPIRDVIDYRFYSADEVLDCILLRGEKKKQIRLEKPFGQDLGLEFESTSFRRCANHCLFCFVDQNPKTVRKSLIFKDEDYRLSFLHGNYVTLTHLKKEDLERIVEQRLSPLYLSIHATNGAVRKRLLGLNREDHLLEKIEYLTGHRIELHGQIVLCRGINDGAVLEESLDTLSSFYPSLRSIAVVPVGLTKHREGLPRIDGYERDSARVVLSQVKKYQKRFKNKLGEIFVYLSDEFYLLSGKPLPSTEHYGDFWQVENGVGLTRTFLNGFSEAMKTVPKKLTRPQQLTWITSVLAGPILQRTVLPKLKKIRNLDVDLRIVPNHFFGESVTVSGLITGSDIIETLREDKRETIVCLPPNCLNQERIFLDDFSLADLEKELKRPVVIIEDIGELWKILN